jgi:hypothetical protein
MSTVQQLLTADRVFAASIRTEWFRSVCPKYTHQGLRTLDNVMYIAVAGQPVALAVLTESQGTWSLTLVEVDPMSGSQDATRHHQAPQQAGAKAQ